MPLRGGDLVPDTFAGDLTLELGKGQQHIEGQPSHRGGGVKRLSHRYKGRVVGIKDINDFGKIREASCEPVDFVDHHHIDEALLDVCQQFAQSRSLDGSTRITTVVIEVGKASPALMFLARDKSLTGLPLGIQGVKFLVKSFFG